MSDTHGFHADIRIPLDIDVIVHSGDISNHPDSHKNSNEVLSFLDWYESIPCKWKILVAGNHDTSIYRRLIKPLDIFNRNIIYLENTGCTIDNISFWGSPYTPTFGDWAFMMNRNKINRVWDLIPDSVDVLITHGPPKGILDSAYDFDKHGAIFRCGCKTLLNRIKQVRPKYHLFGHIHSNKDLINNGILQSAEIGTIFSNASAIDHGGNIVCYGNILTCG